MTRAQNALKRVLSQRSKDGQRTAVPVFGNGLNIQAALEAGVDPADDWPVMLRGIAEQMGMGSEEFDQLPDSAPLSWDALVEWKAWYDLFFLAPLIFIGARLPLEEWPIWWLLHQRARNYVPFPRSAAQQAFCLIAASDAKRHLERQPCDIEFVEFPSHDDMWAFVLRAG
jgi:hypothetical protein